MKYNPLHGHCGPLNSVDPSPVANRVDEACRIHDLAYGRYGDAYPYTHYVPADDVLLKKLYKSFWSLKLDEQYAVEHYIAYFEAKRLTAPPGKSFCKYVLRVRTYYRRFNGWKCRYQCGDV